MIAAALLVLSAGLVAPEGKPQEGERRPNVVLILWDAPCEVDELASSPAVAQLIEDGAVMRNAHVPMPRGRASWGALLSGRHPHQTGVRNFAARARLDPDATLPGLLSRAGYATIACGKLPTKNLAGAGFDAGGESLDVLTASGEEALFTRLERVAGEQPFFVWWAPQVVESADSARSLDEALGRLVAQLVALGEHEQTLFVFLDDPDQKRRQWTFDKDLLRERRLRTPLCFVHPAIAPGSLDELATTLDVYPTILDFAGVEVPASAAGHSLRGRLTTKEPLAPRAIDGAYYRPPTNAGEGGKRGRPRDLVAMYRRTARWKLVLFLEDVVYEDPATDTVAYPVSAGEQLLFDLENDPDEEVDLSGLPAHAETLAGLRADLLAWWSSSGGADLRLPSLFGGLPPPPKDALPNIVLLISDDQDYEHLGFMGNERVHTPTLDTLAESGVVFGTAHVSMSRCRPSLGSLLSGRYPHQTGIYSNQTSRVLTRKNSLPNLLKSAGYATFVGGKFWEGSHHSMGFVAPERQRRNQFVREDQAELFSFLDEHAGERPVFVWWAPLLPHGPFNPPEETLALFDPETIPLPEGFAGDAREYRRAEHLSLAMEAWLDAGLQELHAKLRELGIDENTLFAFLIDNGYSNDGPSKGSVFEKGLQTPVFFSWKGHITGGRKLEPLVASVDVYSTLLDYAGIPVPETSMGRSLRPFLEADGGAPREALFGAVYKNPLRQGPARPAKDLYALYARTAEWKYVLYLRDVVAGGADLYEGFGSFPARKRGDENLYRLTADPLELDDLSGAPEHAELRERLRAQALSWWQETGGWELELR